MAVATIIRNGEIFAPQSLGKQDVLCLDRSIVKIGEIKASAAKDLGLEVQEIDAEGCLVFPGFIDPHQHIIGGSGEKGFAFRSPPITIPEIIAGGITTVVGCIGTDTFFRNMPSLLAQAREFNEEGITAYIYSGGYTVPPSTLTGSIRKDIILISEVIGGGELAISDRRSSQPSIKELARVVADCYVGGILTGKCGVTHFHLGDSAGKLDPLIKLCERHDVEKDSLYATHVNRNDSLLKQAAELTTDGFFVDLDTTDQRLPDELKKFVDWGGDLQMVTLSSDASFTSPATLWQEIVKVHKSLGWNWEKLLPLFTTNPARILKFIRKGKIEEGYDADITVVDKRTLDVKHVIANGKVFMRDRKFVPQLKCMKDSNRKIELYGKKEER